MKKLKMADADGNVADVHIKWTNERVALFIDLRAQYDDFFTKKRGSATAGWIKIAESMGYHRPAAYKRILQYKWAHLTRKYRDIKDSQSGMPSKRDTPPTGTNWPFYDALESFLGNKHRTIDSPFVTDSAQNTFSTVSTSYSSCSSTPEGAERPLFVCVDSLPPSQTPSPAVPTSTASLHDASQPNASIGDAMTTPVQDHSTPLENARPCCSSGETPPIKKKRMKKENKNEPPDEWLQYLKEQDEKELQVTISIKDILKDYFDSKNKPE